MSVRLSNDLKIFVTSNLNTANNISVTDFTQENTQELVIQSGSLNFDLEKVYEYIDFSQILSSDNQLESYAKSNVSIGSMSMSTYLNSSNSGPFDVRLWNGISNESQYPGSKWSINSTTMSMKLLRDTSRLDVFGIIVISGDTAYLLNASRIESCNIKHSISDLVICDWAIKFQELVVLENVAVTETNTNYVFSSGLTGVADKTILSEYNFCPAKMMLVNVNNPEGTSLGSLAATDLSITLTNTLNYIENTHIDKQTLGYNFTGASTFSVTGNLSFYTRNTGSYSNSLVQEIIETNNNPYINKIYALSIELPITKTKKLCDIVLGYCQVSVNTQFSNALTNTLNFKVVDSNYNDNCFIKFYT